MCFLRESSVAKAKPHRPKPRKHGTNGKLLGPLLSQYWTCRSVDEPYKLVTHCGWYYFPPILLPINLKGWPHVLVLMCTYYQPLSGSFPIFLSPTPAEKAQILIPSFERKRFSILLLLFIPFCPSPWFFFGGMLENNDICNFLRLHSRDILTELSEFGNHMEACVQRKICITDAL